ncbi:MAG: hypothetical protein HYX76_02740, partial [Acidobacteria bacterium]|nr:hypothetical protein [Acidobacteriota bacterium]
MTKRSFSGLLAAALLLLIAGLMMRAERQEARVEPGRDEEGAVTLHNGWRLAPAGRHVTVGNLPLALIQSPDARHLIVTNDGYGKPTLSVIDVASWSAKEHFPLEHAWLGLAWHPDGTRLFSSGASQNAVQELKYENGSLAPLRVIQLPPAKNAFVGGLAPHPDGTRLFVVRVLPQDLVVIDLTRGEVEKTLPLAAEPYTSVVSADGKKLYVSVWGGAKVLEIDSATATVAREIAVGEHPNAMMLTRDGRLFVACANTNAVWAVDLASGRSREQISVALYPDAPAGSTPNSLAGSPDDRTLLVANADNNTVAVVDISKRDRSHVTGFIPAGWYPTGAIFSRDGKQIFVISGKGLASAANPNGPLPTDPTRRRPRDQYTGSMFR